MALSARATARSWTHRRSKAGLTDYGKAGVAVTGAFLAAGTPAGPLAAATAVGSVMSNAQTIGTIAGDWMNAVDYVNATNAQFGLGIWDSAAVDVSVGTGGDGGVDNQAYVPPQWSDYAGNA